MNGQHDEENLGFFHIKMMIRLARPHTYFDFLSKRADIMSLFN